MITVISINFNANSLLLTETYGNLERQLETPQTWRQIEIKTAPLESLCPKTPFRSYGLPS